MANTTSYGQHGMGSAELQQAIDDLPNGGTLELEAGTYALGPAGIVITANKYVRIIGYGAVLQLPANGVGITVNQGNVSTRGVQLEGLVIDGQGNASTTGVLLRDTNNAKLISVQVENCTTAISLNSHAANGFVEGTTLIDVTLRNNTTGVWFNVDAGTGSFGQTVIHALKCVVGGSGTGVLIDANAILYRGWLQGTVWIASNQTAININGDVTNTTLRFGVEGSSGSTGNIALLASASALHVDLAEINLLLTGTINTQVSNPNAFAFNYYSQANPAQAVATSGTSVLGYKRTGDTANRVQLEQLNAGGRISFGPGNGAVDANLARSAAANLTSNANLHPTSLAAQVKAGTPTDTDIVGTVSDGQIVGDTSGSKIWIRLGGSWKSVAVA